MKKVLITGVSSGIGHNACKHLIERGYIVFGSVRSPSDLDRLKREFKSSFHGLLFDLRDPKAIDLACAEVERHLAGENLHALINSAGIATPGPLFYMTEDDFDEQMEVNLKGVFRVTNRFLPLLGLRKENNMPPGKIINISSVSGLFNMPFNGLYCISKHALESMNDIYRRELIPFGIDVIAIEPGPVKTPIWEKASEKHLHEKFTGTLYASFLERSQQVIAKSEQSALPPEEVSRLIEKILKSKRPKSRYLLHRKPWLVKFVSNYVPDRLIDRWVMRQYKKDKLRPF